jgi:hypothetical protein
VFAVIAYLIPTLVVLLLVAAASRVRRHIEPSCPRCSSRDWQETPTVLQCGPCGWSTVTRADAALERQAA